MTDDDIDCSDIVELDAEFFNNVEVVMPPEKKHVSIRLDAGKLDWMKAQGKGYQSTHQCDFAILLRSAPQPAGMRAEVNTFPAKC